MDYAEAYLVPVITVFNALILSYFLVGNGIYTFLMILSIRASLTHSRRAAYRALDALRQSPLTPPVTIIVPAWNEQEVIVETVVSALHSDYPHFDVIVVDDGSTDLTLDLLIARFGLVALNRVYHPRIPTAPIRAFYTSPQIPNLLVASKRRGGKPDALNAGINLSHSPYFCSLDADCLLEPDALLRLMEPVLNSTVQTVASGGIIRILNGCQSSDGRVVKVGLPVKWLERFQVVEYLRSFLYGRNGWHMLGGTLIMSGALAIFHRPTMIQAGGVSGDTVTEDMDLIVQLHQWAAERGQKIRMSFISEPVCWTECPSKISALGHQRRRWQLGLCQVLWKHSQIMFGRKYGVVGWLSYPFHAYVEGLGAAVEFLGYLMIPLEVVLKIVSPEMLVIYLTLGLLYGAFLSVGAVLLEELSHRRYPHMGDLMTLILCAAIENLGYRQLILFYRFQGVLRFVAGSRGWEKVAHVGVAAEA
jgi:cellulose synthase/poly-beta-1,6-N-acetylglucosamine synthase-like glycosyltransferase